MPKRSHHPVVVRNRVGAIFRNLAEPWVATGGDRRAVALAGRKRTKAERIGIRIRDQFVNSVVSEIP